uniref:Uncharacterized protein n=1 Tax=Malurus cyaneus samueli TaxID=2593467 RepID=A0A8C5SY47_9PASS
MPLNTASRLKDTQKLRGHISHSGTQHHITGSTWTTWTLVTSEKQEKLAAPGHSHYALRYYKILGKGNLPKQLANVKAKFFSRRVERKTQRR